MKLSQEREGDNFSAGKDEELRDLAAFLEQTDRTRDELYWKMMEAGENQRPERARGKRK